MSIRDVAGKYYKDGYNCSEAIVMSFCPDESPELYRALGGFGAGMCCKKTCGALAACVAVLGMKLIKVRLGESPENKAVIGKFMREFEEKFTSTDCSVLNPLHQVEGERCVSMVYEAADFLEEFMKNYIEGNN